MATAEVSAGARVWSLAKRYRIAWEHERSRLAQVLHDGMMQSLTVLSLELHLLEAGYNSDARPSVEETKQKLAELVILVARMTQGIREFQTALRPRVLDHYGLIAALEWATDQLPKKRGIRAQFRAPEAELQISPEIATAVYRVYEQIIAHAVARCDAESLEVEVKHERGELTLDVSVSLAGQGHSSAFLSPIDLLELRERVQDFGGRCECEPRTGEGARVTLSIPIVAQPSIAAGCGIA